MSEARKPNYLVNAARSLHLELISISEQITDSNDPASRAKAVKRIENVKKLMKSVNEVFTRWAEELKLEEADKKEFVKSVMGDIESLSIFGLENE